MDALSLVTSKNQLNNLQEAVNSMSEDLGKSLGVSPNQVVNGYGITTARKLESEFVNIIVSNFILLKKYLQELKSYVSQNQNMERNDIIKLVEGCENIVKIIWKTSNKDVAFFELLAMPTMEIKQIIKQIKQIFPEKVLMVA